MSASRIATLVEGGTTARMPTAASEATTACNSGKRSSRSQYRCTRAFILAYTCMIASFHLPHRSITRNLRRQQPCATRSRRGATLGVWNIAAATTLHHPSISHTHLITLHMFLRRLRHHRDTHSDWFTSRKRPLLHTLLQGQLHATSLSHPMNETPTARWPTRAARRRSPRSPCDCRDPPPPARIRDTPRVGPTSPRGENTHVDDGGDLLPRIGPESDAVHGDSTEVAQRQQSFREIDGVGNALFRSHAMYRMATMTTRRERGLCGQSSSL